LRTTFIKKLIISVISLGWIFISFAIPLLANVMPMSELEKKQHNSEALFSSLNGITLYEFLVFFIEGLILWRMIKLKLWKSMLVSLILNLITWGMGILIFDIDDVNQATMLIMILFIMLLINICYNPPKYFSSIIILGILVGFLWLGDIDFLGYSFSISSNKIFSPTLLIWGYCLSVLGETFFGILIFRLKNIWKVMLIANLITRILLIFMFICLSLFQN